MGYPISAILISAKYLMLLLLQDNLGSWQSKTLTQVEQNDQFCCAYPQLLDDLASP
jgi:hypothetical protein